MEFCSRTEEDRVSFNRRFHLKDGTVRFNPGVRNPEIVRPAGPIDPDLPFLLFTKDKKPVGSLTVFALHADTVGGTEYSADYPGQLAAELRREFGDGFISIFGTGTCGDINHIDVSGTRRYDARLIGQQLAVRILSARSRLPLAARARGRRRPAVAAARKVSDEQAALGARATCQSRHQRAAVPEQVEIVTTLDLLRARTDARRRDPGAPPASRPRHRPAAGRSVRRAGPRDQAGVAVQAHARHRARQRQPRLHPDGEGVQGRQLRDVNSRIAPGGGERLAEAAIQLLKEAAGR